jgi:hypothetical protein
MAYNVAYAFERTPFYRPWLSWIGVDVRRLGIEDLVSVNLHLLWTVFTEPDCAASGSGHGRKSKVSGEKRRSDGRVASPPFNFTSTSSRLP